jgi:hypothetical protein
MIIRNVTIMCDNFEERIIEVIIALCYNGKRNIREERLYENAL